MAMLLPISDCKVTDAGAFLTHLVNKWTTTSSGITTISTSNPAVQNSITFLRAEQLTSMLFHIGAPGADTSLEFKVDLTNYKACTVSSGTPAVVTIAAHGYTTGDSILFTATTAPTGITRGVVYYINVQTVNTFWVYDTYANALAGGATGRINTTSTGTAVLCHKRIEEKSYLVSDVFGNTLKTTSGGNLQTSQSTMFLSSGWTTIVDTTASKWAVVIRIETAPAFEFRIGLNSLVAWGTTTASAVSGSDSFCFSKQIDMTSGFTLSGYSVLPGDYTRDGFLNPQLLVDPTSGALGNLVVPAAAYIFGFSFSSAAFGKPIQFTSELSLGNTSATLSSVFTGITGTYKVQLLPKEKTEGHPQIDITFTNGSADVTFSALVGNYDNIAVICIPLSANYQIRCSDTNYFLNGSGGIGHSYFYCGESNNKKTWTTLDAGISVGATSLVTKEETGYAIGDVIYIGGGIFTGAFNTMDQTAYTITSISTSGGKDTIGFTPSLATHNRAIRGCVALKTSITADAINIVRLAGSSTTLLYSGGSPANFIICNLNFQYVRLQINFVAPLGKSQNIADKRHYLYNCYNGLPEVWNPWEGIFIDYYSCRAGTPAVSQNDTFLYNKETFISNYLCWACTNTFIFSTKKVEYNVLQIEPNLAGNAINANVSMLPTTIIRNLFIWSTLTKASGLFVGGSKGLIENVYIDGALYGIVPSGSNFTLIKNLYLGQIRANTYDVAMPQSYQFCEIELNNIASNFSVYLTQQLNLIDGSHVRCTDINGVVGEHRIFHAFGESSMTGTGLSDTTLHNGHPTMKFVANNDSYPLNWIQTVPTGNIQNRDMMIGLWCKINSANYWAGTHEMPRLTIDYDNGTILYAEANQSTDWQYLSVPFTPLTETAYVDAKLTSLTDAVSTDKDVYFADYSVLYPAGYVLNLGVFDNTTAGFPTVPTIATSISAADVWSADPNFFGAGTAGEVFNTIYKLCKLVRNLVA